MKPLIIIVGTLFLLSCTTTVEQLKDAMEIDNPENAYIVVTIDNTTKQMMNLNPYNFWIQLRKEYGSLTMPEIVKLHQNNSDRFILYRINPGVYRIWSINAMAGGIFSNNGIYEFRMTGPLLNYFTILPGEIAYLGSFQLKGGINVELSSEIEMQEVMAEMISENGNLLNFNWFSLADDRPSVIE